MNSHSFTALMQLDIWRIHDFNYQLPKDHRKDYWEKECIDHPTIPIANFNGNID